MNPKIEQHLLGHLLNADDPNTCGDVERLVGCNPRSRRTLEALRAALAPLAADKEDEAPPPDLWLRTLSRVAEYMVATESPPSQAGEPPAFGRILNQHLNGAPAAAPPKPPAKKSAPPMLMPASDPDINLPRRWNVVAVVGLSLAGLALVFPAVIHVRAHADRMACQDSMRRFHAATESYAERNDGRMPQVEDGERVFRIVAMLEDSGSVGPNERFHCPASPKGSGAPTFAHYSYTLGYRDGDGELRGLNARTDNTALALLADAPLRTGDTPAPANHRHGQNVLFLGGHVRFCTHANVGVDQDNIFVNDRGEVGAGLRRFDSALGRADERP